MKGKLPDLICSLERKYVYTAWITCPNSKEEIASSQKRFWVEITLLGIGNNFYLPCCCFLVYDDLKSLFTKLVTETG